MYEPTGGMPSVDHNIACKERLQVHMKVNFKQQVEHKCKMILTTSSWHVSFLLVKQCAFDSLSYEFKGKMVTLVPYLGKTDCYINAKPFFFLLTVP